jgi:hypothetical protein
MQFILQWLDFLWLPVGLAVLRRDQRAWAAGFFAGCMLMMRLQCELMESISHDRGLIGLMESTVRARGLAVYSAFYVIFLVWALFSPYARGTIMMAASISVFFMAIMTAMAVMCL